MCAIRVLLINTKLYKLKLFDKNEYEVIRLLKLRSYRQHIVKLCYVHFFKMFVYNCVNTDGLSFHLRPFSTGKVYKLNQNPEASYFMSTKLQRDPKL